MGIERKLQYRHWLRTSEHWQTVRLYCLGRDGMACFGCGHVSEKNDAHHMFYPKKGGWKKTGMWHLRTLCRTCHKEIHERTDPSKYQNYGAAARAFAYAVNEIRFRHYLPALRGRGFTIGEPSDPKQYIADKITRFLVQLGAVQPFISIPDDVMESALTPLRIAAA